MVEALEPVKALRDAVWARSPQGGPTREYALLAGPNLVQAMIPTSKETRRAAATSLLRRTNRTSRVEVVGRVALATAARSGVLQRALSKRADLPATLPQGSVAEWVCEFFGRDDLVFIGGIGHPRTNAKPVVQVLTPEGAVVAWAKLGTNRLTRRLVDAEFASVGRVGGTSSGIAVPSPLARAELDDVTAILLGPLPGWTGSIRRPGAPSASEAMAVAALGDGVSHCMVFESDYATNVLARAAACSDAVIGRLATEAFKRSADQIEEPLSLGTFHGDFVPWNMLQTAGRLNLWDWERSRSSVPVGFDSIHYIAQTRRPSRGSSDKFLDGLPHFDVALRDLGITRPACLSLVCMYLIEMLLRYSADGDFVGSQQAAPAVAAYAKSLEQVLVEVRRR